MNDVLSIGILLGLVVGVFLVYACFTLLHFRFRVSVYRAKHKNALWETFIATGFWDVVRTTDKQSILLLNWGKSETLNLNDIIGYQVSLERVVRRMNNGLPSSGTLNGSVELSTKTKGTFTVFVGDGEHAAEIGTSLNAIGIRPLDQSITTVGEG